MVAGIDGANTKKAMETMEFKKAVFHRGLNYTVRKGDKWACRLLPGDTIHLKETDGEVKGTAVIASVVVKHMGNLPDLVYRYEHDTDCKGWTALCDAMIEAYPELGDKVSLYQELVTVVGFVPMIDRPAEREKVYELIDGEIEFCEKWERGHPTCKLPNKDRPMEVWLAWAQANLTDAFEQACGSSDKRLALDAVRVMAGILVQCMTYNETPPRRKRVDRPHREWVIREFNWMS